MTSTLINGFAISNFRSFSTEFSYFGPFEKINLLIGTNNSGKSNFLRYIRKYYNKITTKNNTPFSVDTMDLPRKTSGTTPYYPILVIYEDIISKLNYPKGHETIRNILGKNLDSEKHPLGTQWLNLLKNGNALDVDVESLDGFNDEEQRDIDRLWRSMTNQSRGSFKSHWLPETLRALASTLVEPKIEFVPAFRKIGSRLSEYAEDYEQDSDRKDKTYENLAQLSSPLHHQQENKEKFRLIVNFLRDVINEPKLELEIPHDRSTINVHLHGKTLPIEALGTGIHELIILASRTIFISGSVICIEEPESHFHPELQRQFMKFVYEKTNNQYFFTTHSAHIMDSVPCSIHRIYLEDGISKVSRPLSGNERREVCQELGYRPSDLLQSNCLIWVEGPSDRIYLEHWIKTKEPKLIEGLHFSIMFYGGALRSHLSAKDTEVEDLVALLPINRFPILLMDSDKDRQGQKINENKLRIQAELKINNGLCWITQGREIENYIRREVLSGAVKEVHRGCAELSATDIKYGKPLNFFDKKDNIEVTKGFDKIGIARKVCETSPDFKVLDLETRINEVVEYIKKANNIRQTA